MQFAPDRPSPFSRPPPLGRAPPRDLLKQGPGGPLTECGGPWPPTGGRFGRTVRAAAPSAVDGGSQWSLLHRPRSPPTKSSAGCGPGRLKGPHPQRSAPPRGRRGLGKLAPLDGVCQLEAPLRVRVHASRLRARGT